MTTAQPAITVAICTRNRTVELERLLNSLQVQRRMPDEVLIVDNAPSDARTRELIAQRYQWCRYTHEPVPGLDFARNRALQESRSDVVAFVDDDAVVADEWVQAIGAVFTESTLVAVCMGRIDALSLATEGQRLFEANGGFSRGDRRIHVTPGRRMPGVPRPLIAWSLGVGSGVSMAIRRRLAIELGGFDEALDMGAVLPGGGDLDMLWRVLDAGYELVYEPRAHGWHEHRRELAAAQMQILEHNRAMIAGLTKSLHVAAGRRKAPIAAFLAWRLLKPFARLARAALGRDPLPVPLLCRLVIHTWRGLWAYPKAQRLAESRRREFDSKSTEMLDAVHGLQPGPAANGPR